MRTTMTKVRANGLHKMNFNTYKSMWINCEEWYDEDNYTIYRVTVEISDKKGNFKRVCSTECLKADRKKEMRYLAKKYKHLIAQ